MLLLSILRTRSDRLARTSVRRGLLVYSFCVTCILFAMIFIGLPVVAIGAPAPPLLYHDAPILGQPTNDRPASTSPAVSPEHSAGAPDTLGFGFVDVDGFAIEGDVWTWDHGTANRRGLSFEGWEAEDLTEQSDAIAFFRRITPGIWATGGNLATAPILAGNGSLWSGYFHDEADDEAWDAGLGYGNNWHNRAMSPVLSHSTNQSDILTLSFEYFTDLEPDYDYIRVYYKSLPSGVLTHLESFTGPAGLAPNHPNSPPEGEIFTTQIPVGQFGGTTDFQLVFTMSSDGSWSDEDGLFATEYGPFAVDNVAIASLFGFNPDLDVLYTFETDLEGWTMSVVPGVGDFLGVADVSTYVIEDFCGSTLTGNVLEMHDDNLEHPAGQHMLALSNPVDILNDVSLPGSGDLEIFVDWSQYSHQPRANGVFYRPGYKYFPAINPHTGAAMWSGRVGQSLFYFTGDDPVAFETRNIATQNGVPSDSEQIRFAYELYSSCDAFAVPPNECSGVTNFTPLIDNVQIRFTLVPNAPRLVFTPGDRYTDGFSQSQFLDPNVPGNADIIWNTSFGNNTPIINGDSLHVEGPVPAPGSEYDARLWFRVARKGPGTNTSPYDAWRAKVEQDGGIDAAIDGAVNIEAGQFATAKMDSFQNGTNPSSKSFISYFIEEDARFDAGAGEISDANEIIADGMLLPGTSIEYFITGNYVSQVPVQYSLLPDTSGGFFHEFEILPGWIDDGGTLKFPCLLYVDAYNRGAEFFIESALDALGRRFDRYDYGDASSNWKAPMARGLTGDATNGCTTVQLLGYRTLLVNTGSSSGNVMWPEDYLMFGDWLTAVACDANTARQGLIMNGDNMAAILNGTGPALLSGPLGATFVATTYSQEGGTPDESYCVRLESPTVGSFDYGTIHSTNDYDYDAYGNWCPQSYSFDVLETTGSGVGNRSYVNVLSSAETNYAQITNESASGADNYRTVLDGVSYHHLSERDAVEECVGDSAHIVTAALNEISAALEWVFGVGTIPDLCENPCVGVDPANAPEVGSNAGVTRLFQNSPNPFNPITTLRFSLAASGPAELVIYDVTGRKVRTLVQAVLEAGSHEAIWDGTNEAGEDVPTGIFWSQLDAGGLKSNKKMVFLKK